MKGVFFTGLPGDSVFFIPETSRPLKTQGPLTINTIFRGASTLQIYFRLRDSMKKIQKIAPAKPFLLPLASLALTGMLVLSCSTGARGEQQEDESQFIRAGTLSYSKQYILAKDLSHIIFKIKNHNPRTVTQIFGWIYRTPVPGKGEPADNTKMILVNNPHRGGLLVKDGPHRPGKVSQWRFLLDREMIGATEKDQFTLRVSPKGVFFAHMEPAPEAGGNKKKKTPK